MRLGTARTRTRTRTRSRAAVHGSRPRLDAHRRGSAAAKGALVLALGAALALGPVTAKAEAQQPHPGKVVYDRWCAQCHGEEGRGDGVAAGYMLPRPRDFTRALYQIRTTPSGALPTDADIRRVIDEGMPGTAMPGWKDRLSEAERAALVDYLKTFSRFFAQETAPEPIAVGRAPRVTAEGLAEGREFYDKIECWKCHGRAGRADGPSAPTLVGDDGYPIRPADLTKNWRFNGGGSVEAIYMRLRTGIDGTPMPSFSDLLESGFMTEEQLWRVAQYVRSLSPERPPVVREVVRAALVDGALPATPDDSAWAAAEAYYIPLVGQIITKPRWFAPTVDGVWVQALHDGTELAIRLTWNDPSNSPDPAWSEWQARVLEVMEPRDEAPGGGAELPDAFALQFPFTIPTGMERPYFLMGNAREPVYLWRWQSRPSVPTEARARGFGRIEPLAVGEAPVRAEAVFDEGQWRLVFRRALVTPDSTERLQFRTGEAIPVAFFAWDGSNGEEGGRAAISTWYYVYLDRPTPGTVYATPAVAMLLTAGLGFGVVARAQRRESRARSQDPE